MFDRQLCFPAPLAALLLAIFLAGWHDGSSLPPQRPATPGGQDAVRPATATRPPAPPAYPASSLYIVRFSSYRPAAEHRAALAAPLGSLGWAWVDRQNAAMRFPTDFGLVRADGAALKDVQVRGVEIIEIN